MAAVGSWVWLPDDNEYMIPGEVLVLSKDIVKARLESGKVIL